MSATRRFIDIGANLLDPMYSGIYRSKPRHEADLDLVLERSWSAGLDKIVITAGSLEESKQALELSQNDERLYCTVGIHPTRCSVFSSPEEEERILAEMLNLCRSGIKDRKVVALGEMGLDYDRVEFCPIPTQTKGFLAQLTLAQETNLPLFLHNRNTGRDLFGLVSRHRDQFSRGIVHSFDDTLELAKSFIDLDLYIGLNGCSLKTQENLEVVKELPLDRILLETDCPWCDIRASHAGSKFVKTKYESKNEKKFQRGTCVKSRNEPCGIVQVAEVVAGVKGLDVEEVASACYRNSMDFYRFGG